MAIPLLGKPQIQGTSAEYPYGNIKDDTGSDDGTPVSKLVYADFHQFFAKMMDASGIPYNNIPENAYDGFQYFQALQKVMNDLMQPEAFKKAEDYASAGSLATWGTYNVRFHKDKMGYVHIEGDAKIQDITPFNPVLFTLPAGYRPSIRIVYNGLNTNSSDLMRLAVNTNGDVGLFNSPGDDPSLLYPPSFELVGFSIIFHAS